MLTASEVTGNCNTSTTTILVKAGVDANAIKALGFFIPDLAWGFGSVRPWTASEQKKALEGITIEHLQLQKRAEHNAANNFFFQ